MSAVCDVCDKKPRFGRAVARAGKGAQTRHIKGRTSRMFRPNVQHVRTVVNGQPKRLNVCTSCLKAGKVKRATA